MEDSVRHEAGMLAIAQEEGNGKGRESSDDKGDEGGGGADQEDTETTEELDPHKEGLIHDMISNLPVSIPNLTPEEDHKKEGAVQDSSGNSTTGGGGLIDHLLSSLPASTAAPSSSPLSPTDDQVPEAEEASLLISIIED